MELNRDFSEFIACFTARDVRFLIVGGYAVAAHGHPRYTKDLDVWVRVDPENARRIVDALGDFGFGGLGLAVDDARSGRVGGASGGDPVEGAGPCRARMCAIARHAVAALDETLAAAARPDGNADA